MLCQGRAETHEKDTELGQKGSSAVAALFLACVQVCVHLAPTRSGFLSVWYSVISAPLSQPTFLHVSVCVGFKASVCLPVPPPVWSVGFPPLHPLTNQSASRRSDVCHALSFPLGVWKCEYHQVSWGGSMSPGPCPLGCTSRLPVAGAWRMGRVWRSHRQDESRTEPELLQEDVEGDSGGHEQVQLPASHRHPLPSIGSASSQLWVWGLSLASLRLYS